MEDGDEDFPLRKYREKLFNISKQSVEGCHKLVKKSKRRITKKANNFPIKKFDSRSEKNNIILSDSDEEICVEELLRNESKIVHYYKTSEAQTEETHFTKRKRFIDSWQRKKTKQSRGNGEAYIIVKDIVVPGKQPCFESCL